MRGEFDRWTESTQVGFLRMCDETARLARVMERSEQLARASQLRGQQQLGSGILRVPVSSIRDLCLDALAREGLPEGCLSPGPDVGLTTDPFWLVSVCKTFYATPRSMVRLPSGSSSARRPRDASSSLCRMPGNFARRFSRRETAFFRSPKRPRRCRTHKRGAWDLGCTLFPRQQ
jgi:hypothetical protein